MHFRRIRMCKRIRSAKCPWIPHEKWLMYPRERKKAEIGTVSSAGVASFLHRERGGDRIPRETLVDAPAYATIAHDFAEKNPSCA